VASRRNILSRRSSYGVNLSLVGSPVEPPVIWRCRRDGSQSFATASSSVARRISALRVRGTRCKSSSVRKIDPGGIQPGRSICFRKERFRRRGGAGHANERSDSFLAHAATRSVPRLGLLCRQRRLPGGDRRGIEGEISGSSWTSTKSLTRQVSSLDVRSLVPEPRLRSITTYWPSLSASTCFAKYPPKCHKLRRSNETLSGALTEKCHISEKTKGCGICRGEEERHCEGA
jgi:hypothetical protein